MGRQRRYPVEFRERAVRLVYEWRDARDRSDGGLDEVGQQLAPEDATIELLEIIRRNASVLKILASVDPEFVKHPNPGDQRLVFHDAWGKAMLVVFPGRLWVQGVDQANYGPPDEDRTIRTGTESECGVAVDRRICFVSAGPDGEFGNFDQTSPDYDPEAAQDNLYSYDPQIDP